eukprot:PhM_4_TR2983/c0_g1_i1/m.69300
MDAAAPFLTGKDAPPFCTSYAPYTGPRDPMRCPSSCLSGTNFVDPERDLAYSWDSFYRAHAEATPYPDRHYLFDELPELTTAASLLEVGCGIGSTVIPMLQEYTPRGLKLDDITCIDVSSVAVNRLKARPELVQAQQTGRPCAARALVCDIVSDVVPKCPSPTTGPSYDIITLIFCLSSVPEGAMVRSVQKLWERLRSGGTLYFRDYADEDHAQTRFADGGAASSGASTYLRKNGTLSHFFTKQRVEELFLGLPGVSVQEIGHVERDRTAMVGNEETVIMHRKFWQCRFHKN